MTQLSLPVARSSFGPVGASQTRPVIVAVGGRETDAALLDAARRLAAPSGAEVVVLSVVEPIAPFSTDRDELLPAPGLVESQAAERLEVVGTQVNRVRAGEPDPGPRWPVEIRYGRPAETIAAEATLADAQLVVMGIGRHKPIDRLLAAETTLATVRRAPCPVFALSDPMRRLPTVAVAATDFGPASVHAIRTALPLLAEGATLYLLHVWSRAGTAHPGLEASDVAYERSLPERFERLRELLAAPPRSVVVKPVELVGDPAEEVLEFARGHGAELVVAGTHGRGFLDRLLVGSVATALLRGAQCHVLIAPEPPPGQDDGAGLDPASSAGVWREGWAIRLDEFAHRNHGRKVALEVVDRRLGAYVLESGYTLLGASYDESKDRIELTLGDAARDIPSLTHVVVGAIGVDVIAGAAGRDRALSILGERGHTRLRFTSG